MTFTISKRPLFTFSKNEILEPSHNCLLSNWSRFLNWKGPATWPQSSKLFKRFLKIISLTFICGQVRWLNEMWLKRYIQKCTLSHGMLKNTKTWTSWEWSITFLQIKILICALVVFFPPDFGQKFSDLLKNVCSCKLFLRSSSNLQEIVGC